MPEEGCWEKVDTEMRSSPAILRSDDAPSVEDEEAAAVLVRTTVPTTAA